MKKYNDLKCQYDILDENYTILYGEKLQLEYELNSIKSENLHSLKQSDEIRELHENVRRMKHDMKNHLMVIASYLNNEDYKNAKIYTSEILDKLNSVHSYIETGNSLMNHIINEKLEYARSKNINIKAEIENLSFDKMESLDFSAVLSNILDNAIEACLKEETPELYVNISKKRSYETILVKNRISTPILATNPSLNSTKVETNLHGLGISQIKSIAEKYSGLCDFYEEDGYFCVCFMLP